jgi:DNA-binding response OmpR family regulator
MRLLLIEDNARLGSLVRDGLIPQGFAVDWVETVEDAELAMKVATYDLLLVDLGLPDGDGLDIVRRSRRDKNATPILVLTARGGLDDRVTGLDAGADDYLVKPFQIPELAARCRALLRTSCSIVPHGRPTWAASRSTRRRVKSTCSKFCSAAPDTSSPSRRLRIRYMRWTPR